MPTSWLARSETEHTERTAGRGSNTAAITIRPRVKRWARRLVPALITLVLLVLLLLAFPGDQPTEQVEASWTPPPAFVSPLPGCPAMDYARLERLVHTSEYVAGLVGSLAMVEAQDRPEMAREVAGAIRFITEREAQSTQLAPVLEDLAQALDRYAAGDPAANVQAASARNAELRAHYQRCVEAQNR